MFFLVIARQRGLALVFHTVRKYCAYNQPEIERHRSNCRLCVNRHVGSKVQKTAEDKVTQALDELNSPVPSWGFPVESSVGSHLPTILKDISRTSRPILKDELYKRFVHKRLCVSRGTKRQSTA